MGGLLTFGFVLASVLFPMVTTLFASNLDEPADILTEYVEENQNLTLVCNSTELTYLRDYYWVKNDTFDNSSVLYASGQMLEFIHITMEDEGTYVCHALDNETAENVTVMAVTVEIEAPDDSKERSMKLGVIIGCSVAGFCMLLLIIVALARRKPKVDRFSGKDFGYSLKSQYGSSVRSTHDRSVKARYGTLDDSRNTFDGSQSTPGYPRIIYKKDQAQLVDSMK